MKNLLFVFLLTLIGAVAYAQPKMQLSANEHNFGVFKEEAGKQTFDFIVTNMGDSALVIQNIVPSCGCTTPEWTRNPIPPKGQGKVTAIYDPANRPGGFNKTLAVYTNSKPEVVVLVIKGEVTAREKTVEELFPWPVGTIRFESSQLAFTNVKKNEKKIRVMQFINTSNAPVTVEFEGMNQYLTLKANPESVKPGQKGIVEGTYDATKNPGAWGNVGDMIKVKLNGVVQNNVYYYVSANLVEDFSGLSKEEIENAPVFKLVTSTVDIGKMDQAASKDAEFPFKNEGKRDLIIRHIRSSCGCTAVQQGNTVIKPGESSSIKATFNSGSYKDKIVKTIYVYTNDPKNSETVLYLNAEVIPKAPEK